MAFSVLQLSPVAGGMCPWWIQHLRPQGLCQYRGRERAGKCQLLSPFHTACQTSAHCFWDIKHLHLKAEKAFFNFWAKSCILLQTVVLWKSMGVLSEWRLQDEAYNPGSGLQGDHTEWGLFAPQDSCWAILLCIPFSSSVSFWGLSLQSVIQVLFGTCSLKRGRTKPAKASLCKLMS